MCRDTDIFRSSLEFTYAGSTHEVAGPARDWTSIAFFRCGLMQRGSWQSLRGVLIM